MYQVEFFTGECWQWLGSFRSKSIAIGFRNRAARRKPGYVHHVIDPTGQQIDIPLVYAPKGK